MSADRVVMLLGRRDEPTDGVRDYCEYLQKAAANRGMEMELAAVSWAEKGWGRALDELRAAAAGWRGRWVLLQFTTLAWSRRGFPLRVPRVLEILRQSGARPGVVFHDIAPLRGKGIVGGAREYCQLRAMRQLYARSEIAIFTVPVNKIDWLPLRRDKAVFIPVGCNFPPPTRVETGADLPSTSTIAVFGITGGPRGTEEVGDIVYALKALQARGIPVRLAALGRGTEVFDGAIAEALEGSGIEHATLGLMSPREFIEALAGTQVLLCVRGQISSRRGSAVAGMICGLPVVGYRGDETGFPVTEAGVRFVNRGDREGLVESLAQILTDPLVYQDLRRRSLAAARDYFSWDAIALQFADALATK